jgi:hypothetical protein
MVTDIPLILMSGRFAICRLSADAGYPEWAGSSELLSLTRTHEELSVVCEERFVPPEIKAERGWRAFQVDGPLDFSQIGILAAIAAPLSAASVSLFVLSTFDTDYILVKENVLPRALDALRQAGHLILIPA